MNFMYGFPLYESKESKKAFNYLKYSDENNNSLCPYDNSEYYLLSNTDQKKLKLILLANSKKVQNILVDKLLPELSIILTAAGQKHGFVAMNGGSMASYLNPFVSHGISSELYEDFMLYIHKKMRSMSALWIYFDGFINKELEHIIKLKYNEFILEGDDGKTYVLLSPDENFSLVYDFIDDVMYYC